MLLVSGTRWDELRHSKPWALEASKHNSVQPRVGTKSIQRHALFSKAELRSRQASQALEDGFSMSVLVHSVLEFAVLHPVLQALRMYTAFEKIVLLYVDLGRCLCHANGQLPQSGRGLGERYRTQRCRTWVL